MEKLVMKTVTRAAVAAGLPAERVMTESAKDNITLPRPRLEVQMQPATYKRTGRKLGVTRTKTQHTTKRELYEILSVHSGVPVKKIEKDADRDYWLSAREAKDYGLIDEVLSKRDK